MPEVDYTWLPRSDILSFEEISRLVDVFVELGVNHVRLTGGEPLLRRNIERLIRDLADKPGILDLALTTNGVLLEKLAERLFVAGLHRLTVSLDTLRPDRFKQLTRRDDLDAVFAGIDASRSAGFEGLKLDSVIMKGVNDDDVIDLLEYGKRVGAEVRFIEYMDVGGATRWSMDDVVSRAAMLEQIAGHFGSATPISEQSCAPADRFTLPDGTLFGVISSTPLRSAHPAIGSRLTADGLCTCASTHAPVSDLRKVLREGASVQEIAELITSTWRARDNRGAEERLANENRQPYTSGDMSEDPHFEMHNAAAVGSAAPDDSDLEKALDDSRAQSLCLCARRRCAARRMPCIHLHFGDRLSRAERLELDLDRRLGTLHSNLRRSAAHRSARALLRRSHCESPRSELGRFGYLPRTLRAHHRLPWPLDSASNLGTFDETGRRATLSALLGACLATTLISTVIPRAIALPIAIVGVLVVLGSTSVSFPPERASWPERPNIILVSIDTQRPDHLSCYGYERVTSPNIDRFAQEAVRFDQVFTPYPWTLVSHMSLFTSLNPTAHGVSPTRALPAGIPTLATHLQQSGYRTVALLDSVKWLAPEFEFDRGFDVYSQVSGGAAEKRRRIAPVTRRPGEPAVRFSSCTSSMYTPTVTSFPTSRPTRTINVLRVTTEGASPAAKRASAVRRGT